MQRAHHRRRSRGYFSRALQRACRVRRDFDPQHADPRRLRPPSGNGRSTRGATADPVRAGAQRSRRGEHGGCLCARVGRHRRGDHQHRDGCRQRLRRNGGGAHRRDAGAASHRADRGSVPRSRSRLHSRSARAAGNAASRFQNGIPHSQPGDGARHAARSGTRGADATTRPGERRDSHRHPGCANRAPHFARAGSD